MGVCSASCSASGGSASEADGLRGGPAGRKDDGALDVAGGPAGGESGVKLASGVKVEVGEEEGWLCRVGFVTADFSAEGAVSGAGSCRVGAAVLSGACSMPFVTGYTVTAAGEMLVHCAAARRKTPCNNRKTGSWCCFNLYSIAPTANFSAGENSLFA